MKYTFDNESQHQRMTGTPIPKLIASLCVPTVASTLISTIYNAADTFFVSQIGTSAAAAVGVVFSLMSVIQALGFGIGMGSGSLISRYLGAKKNEDADRIASSAFFAALLIGFVIMAAGLLMLKDFMRLLGSTQTMLPYSCDYARYILIGAPVMCSAFVLNTTLRAEGLAVRSMVGLCTGGVLNVILDPLLIFTFDMGIAGAAIATVISQTVSFSILLGFFLRRKSIVRMRARLVSKNFGDYALIVKTGFPTICRQGMASVASALLNIRAAVYGDAAVAAITIANKVYLFVRNLVLGIGQGFQPVAGYNFGAGKYSRVKEAFRFSLILGSVISVTMGALIFIFAGDVMAWFRADDPTVIRIGSLALRLVCAVMPVMAYSTYVNQLYQCLGFATGATFLACCRQGVFFIPLIMALPYAFDLLGVQLAQPISDFLTFAISIPFQKSFFKKQLSREDEKEASPAGEPL